MATITHAQQLLGDAFRALTAALDDDDRAGDARQCVADALYQLGIPGDVIHDRPADLPTLAR